MNKKALLVIALCGLLLALFLGKKSFFKEKTAQVKDFVAPLTQQNNLEIENYIFTKISDTKGVVRVYGVSTNEDYVSKFPIEIIYYDDDKKKLGSDTVDLLAKTNAALKPNGELNASVDVAFPKGTHTITLKVHHGK